MTVEQIKQALLEDPSLLKNNSERLAKKLGASIENVILARSKKTPLGVKLETLDLPLSAVDKVKFWDNMAGEQRFSISTKKSWHESLGLQTLDDALEDIKTTFKDKISPIRIKVEEKDNRKALFIYLADLHIGAKTSNNSLFPNHYDANVFKERLQHTLVTIKQNKDFFGVFDALYIVNLGDALDGYNKQTTRGGHMLPQNLDNNEQLDTFFEAHKDLFDTIVSMNAAKRIEYVACTNCNHSGSFGYAANRLLDIYLSCKYPDIKRTIITKFIDYIQYGQHTFMFTHGKDDKDMKFGLPATLNEKTENYINAYIHYHKIQTPAIHLVKGDLHLSAKQPGKIFRYKNVLSLYGSSKWVQTNFMVNKCGYNYEIVDKYSTSIYENEVIFPS
jgi:hypothetical protein